MEGAEKEAKDEPRPTKTVERDGPKPPTLRQVRNMVIAPVRFEYSLTTVDGTEIYSLAGIAHPRAREWTGTLEMNDPSTSAQVDLRARLKSIHRELWLQVEGWPSGLNGCWADVAAGVEALGKLSPSTGIPGAVGALATLKRPNNRAPLPKAPFGASLSVRSAVANVMPPKLAVELDLDNLPSGTVAAQVQVKKQDNVTILVRGLDLSDSLNGLGATVPKEIDGFLRTMNMRVEVRPAVNAPKIERPTEDTIMSPEDADAEGNFSGCPGAKDVDPDSVVS